VQSYFPPWGIFLIPFLLRKRLYPSGLCLGDNGGTLEYHLD